MSFLDTGFKVPALKVDGRLNGDATVTLSGGKTSITVDCKKLPAPLPDQSYRFHADDTVKMADLKQKITDGIQNTIKARSGSGTLSVTIPTSVSLSDLGSFRTGKAPGTWKIVSTFTYSAIGNPEWSGSLVLHVDMPGLGINDQTVNLSDPFTDAEGRKIIISEAVSQATTLIKNAITTSASTWIKWFVDGAISGITGAEKVGQVLHGSPFGQSPDQVVSLVYPKLFSSATDVANAMYGAGTRSASEIGDELESHEFSASDIGTAIKKVLGVGHVDGNWGPHFDTKHADGKGPHADGGHIDDSWGHHDRGHHPFHGDKGGGHSDSNRSHTDRTPHADSPHSDHPAHVDT